MSNSTPNDFRYVLMPGKASFESGQLQSHNQAFEYWQNFWADILMEVTGERRKLLADDFSRQDCIAILYHQNEIIGMHAYSFLNLASKAATEHSYFKKYFNVEFLEQLTKRECHTVMTMEYFSLSKKWQGKDVGISLAKVIACLGLRLAEAMAMDGSITAARSDVPAALLARKLGAIAIGDAIKVHNIPTELMLFPADSAKEPTDTEVQNWIKILWQRRIDLTGFSYDKILTKIA